MQPREMAMCSNVSVAFAMAISMVAVYPLKLDFGEVWFEMASLPTPLFGGQDLFLSKE